MIYIMLFLCEVLYWKLDLSEGLALSALRRLHMLLKWTVLEVMSVLGDMTVS